MYQDAYELSDQLNPLKGGPPDVEDVRDLFRRDSQAAKFVDSMGRTFLHRCLALFPFRLELIRLLCESFPQALSIPDARGKLPLHLLITEVEYKPIPTAQYLVQQRPQALQQQDEEGQFPLHCACKVVSGWHVDWPRDFDLIRVVMQGFPEAVVLPDNQGRCPLHLCLEPDRKGRLPVEAIRMLIDQAPHVLRETIPNSKGQLPLHVAVASSWACSPESCKLSVIELLAEKFPRALVMQDAVKNTPLFDACIHDRRLDIVYVLVRQWPEQLTAHQSATLVFDNTNWNGEMLPVAISSKSATLQRVQQWAQRNPHLLRTKDGICARLPLHYAVASASPSIMAIADCLLKLYPDAASCPDSFGRLPLHYAVLSKSHDARFLVQSLVRQYPRGMIVADHDGLLPWHYAQWAKINFGSLVADSLYEPTASLDPELDEYLVPDDVPWDLLQIFAAGNMD